MKSRRQNLSEEDGLAISRCNSRSSTSMNRRENSEPIPIDLIYECLLRLPAKSIARCRCVSKLWACILRRQHFTELFLTRSSALPQLLFACEKDDDLFLFTALSQPQNLDENSSLVALNYHMKFPFIDISQIFGHLRGLVCLTHLRTVKGRKETVPEICNPSTGQSIPLPKVKTRRVNVKIFFVYDPICKQFKVLSMTWPCYGSSWLCKEHQVLTLGTRNWRMIECSILHHPTDDGMCINGCLYYQAMVGNGSGGVSTVVHFDVCSEKFSLIRKATDAGLWKESTLVNYKGRLGLLTSDEGEVTGKSTYIELCLLVDAEKHEWSRLVYTFPPLWKNVVAEARLYFVGMSGNNEILLSRRYQYPFYVFYYNIEKGTIRRVEIQGMDVFEHCRIHTFLHVEDVKLYANV